MGLCAELATESLKNHMAVVQHRATFSYSIIITLARGLYFLIVCGRG